jgi:hypothetical protein
MEKGCVKGSGTGDSQRQVVAQSLQRQNRGFTVLRKVSRIS